MNMSSRRRFYDMKNICKPIIENTISKKKVKTRLLDHKTSHISSSNNVKKLKNEGQ